MPKVRENAVMFAGDTLSAAEAECYVVINGKNAEKEVKSAYPWKTRERQ